MRSPSRVFASLARSMAVSDPGFVRFRKAVATALTVAVAMGVLVGYASATGNPVTVAMLGTIVAMQASWVVRDPTTRERIVTTVLLVLPACASVTLATVLSQYGKVADAGFIAVLFVAVWARRFGPRGMALGMLAFNSYFFALFLHASMDRLPWMLGAVAIGVAVALVVRNAVLPDRPVTEVRRLARALRVASASVLRRADHGLPGDVEALRKALGRLADTGMLIEDWLDRNQTMLHLDVSGEDLSLRVFDAQIATEQLASALWALEPQARWPSTLRRGMLAVQATLQNEPSESTLRSARRVAADTARRADSSTPAGLAALLAARAAQAHIAIHRITARATRQHDSPAARRRATAPRAKTGRLNPHTRAAIQVAVATSAATVLGELVSPNRWYWAVLTAFLVFTGVSTRGEILTKGGNRIAGTVIGVVAGVLLSAVIGHHPAVQLVLIVVCVFFAFWLVSVSYALLAFFITVLLAMLYGLLGTFSVAVLELRIYETAVGAAVGMVSAFVVLPVKTRETFVRNAIDYLHGMQELVRSAVDGVIAPGDVHALVATARSLDTALQVVMTSGAPLRRGPTTRGRHSTKRVLRVLQIAGRSVHAVARGAVNAGRSEAPPTVSAETATALRSAGQIVCEHIELVIRMLEGAEFERPERDEADAAVSILAAVPNEPGPVRATARALNRLDRTVLELLP